MAIELPITLTGFMGVGKSTVGRRAAFALGREFFDVDQIVTDRLKTSIVELFESGNEALFRRVEQEAVLELLEHRPPGLISLGGGALENETTRLLVMQGSLLVHLDQPWHELEPALSRLRATRPLLKGASNEQIHALYERRRSTYAGAAITVTVRRNGTRRAAESLVEAILSYEAGEKASLS